MSSKRLAQQRKAIQQAALPNLLDAARSAISIAYGHLVVCDVQEVV